MAGGEAVGRGAKYTLSGRSVAAVLEIAFTPHFLTVVVVVDVLGQPHALNL